MSSKKYLSAALLLLSSLPAGWSQTVKTAAADSGRLPTLMSGVLLIAGALLLSAGLLILFRAQQFIMRRLLHLEAEKSGVVLPETIVPDRPVGDDFWTRLRKQYWENRVPPDQEASILLHHDYDGIRELDNHLPPWWVNLFIICVCWAFGYMWYYHWGGGGANQAEEYRHDVESAQQQIAIALAGKASSVDESTVQALTETGPLGEGELIFKNNCTACHGQHGEGMVGPNLTDTYWLHGGGIKNVFRTIKHGVPEKGMISWASQLRPDDIQKVASYILTLQGTNPPNPKAPQGEIWQPSADSTGAAVPSH